MNASATRQHFEGAVRLHRQNRLLEAEAQYRQVLQAEPGHAGALHLLGLLCIQTGRIGEAEALLRRAAAAAPREAEIRNHLGLLLLRLGRPGEAAAECAAALESRPDFADALGNLGLAYGMLGEPEKALGFLERALALSPDDPEIRRNLGEGQLRLGKHEAALACFDKVLAVRPHAIAALLGRGEALAALGRQDYALAAIERALAVDPDYAAAHCARGTVLKQLGRFPESQESFARAVALAPGNPSYHFALAESAPFTEGDARLSALEALAKDDSRFSGQQKAELHFALFKAYDELKRPEEAFAHLEQGNRLYRAIVPYDEAAVFAFFRELEETYTPKAVAARRGAGHASELPVFVVGMPRSGTTLVEQVLASHPEAFGAGELLFVQDLILDGAAGTEYPAGLETLKAEELRRFGAAYAERLRGRAPQARRIVDKLPANFRHLGLLHLALPKARIVHVRRDARDTCFSCYSRLFASGLNYAYDLGELGRYYKAYEGLMAHWRALLPQDVLLEIRYETLVADFEAEARRLIAFCGLDWDEHCLRFHETKRAVRTLSEFQVRRPLFASSIGRWRVYEQWLGPLTAALS